MSKKIRLSQEEKDNLIKKYQAERDLYESKNLGGYDDI